MSIVYDRWGVQIHQGDCLDVMHTLPDASVSAVVTDPPSGTAFMGREWDKNRGGRDQWVEWLTERMAEAHRVLKPGGHALVWALPRTSHWTAWALEDAGFEIRDCVVHLFGQGFVKSLNVSRAIDRMSGAEPEVIGFSVRPDGTTRPNAGAWKTGMGYMDNPATVQYRTTPATDAARQWEGWGSAFKPAAEHWWLCRKPLTSTIAANVLEHGTGALNVDACRVGSRAERVLNRNASIGYGGSSRRGPELDGGSGRWPPNTVFTHAALVDPVSGEVLGDACVDGCVDGCAVAELDRQSGVLTTGAWNGKQSAPKFGAVYNDWHTDSGSRSSDSGGASRFFPCFRWEAKAPTSERPQVSGISHATVKSTNLMKWLVRLVTPPGGTVLDCFAGTGPTGQAARAEGLKAILIEQDPDSVELIRARLESQPRTEAPVAGQSPLEPVRDLFSDVDGGIGTDVV